MSFRYTRAPWTQHTLVASTIALAIALGSTQAVADAWATVVTGSSDRLLLTGGLMLIHTLVFWPVCAGFFLVDTHDRPACIARYRIQVDRRRHPPLDKTLRVLLRNQFLILPALLLALGELLIMRGWRAEAALPSLGRLALELIGQGACALIVFYASHRFLHRKWWVKHVHYLHHEFRTTTALASEYAHPIEFAMANFLTLATGALVIAPHLASMVVFTVVALLTILVHHSGYALPWAPWSLPHDWHHYRFKEMFGTIGLLDRLLGTDREFRTFKDGELR